MRKIKLFPAPHVELKLYVSDQMVVDFKQCCELATLPGGRTDCDNCSWKNVKVGSVGLCELPIVHDKLIAVVE